VTLNSNHLTNRVKEKGKLRKRRRGSEGLGKRTETKEEQRIVVQTLHADVRVKKLGHSGLPSKRGVQRKKGSGIQHRVVRQKGWSKKRCRWGEMKEEGGGWFKLRTAVHE